MYNPKEYWDNRSPSLSLSTEFATVIKELLNKIAAHKVIELGCGSGIWFSLFKEQKLDYTGYDFSPKRIAVAKKRYPTGDFRRGDIARGISDRADVVFTHKVLLHIENERPIKRLAKIAPHLILIEPITNRSGYKQEHIFYHNYLSLISKLAVYQVFPMEIEDTAIFYR